MIKNIYSEQTGTVKMENQSSLILVNEDLQFRTFVISLGIRLAVSWL